MIHKLEKGGAMDDIKALIENLLNDIKDVDKKKIKRKINTDQVKASINLDLGEKNDGYYVSKLRLTGNLLDVPSQVKSQSLKLYIKFARLGEKEVKITKSPYFYNQLYVLARDYVEDFIDPYHEKKSARIYRNIKSLINRDLEPLFGPVAEDFLKNFPSLSKDVIDFYNLTASGKVAVFWDMDGKLRDRYDFQKDEERALLQLSQRRNVLWENPILADLTINLFLKSLKIIFTRPEINSDILKTYARPYTLSKNLLDSLFIMTEANVRNKFSFLAEIKTQRAIDILLENQCDDILRVFMDYQLVFLDDLEDRKIEEIYLEYLKENPQKSNDIAAFIKSLNLDRQVETLRSFDNRENFGEILDNLLKADFTPTRVLALYYIFKNNMERPKDKKALFEIIREENYHDFLDLIRDRNFDIDLVSEVLDLREIKAKRIKLDKSLVKKSRKDLSKTVQTINDFVGGDEDKPNIHEIFEEYKAEDEKEDNQIANDKISPSAKSFLEKILKEGFISKKEATGLAMDQGLFLNVFINNINDELFEYINDQTLVIEDDRILIDEFYEQMVKELIDG